MEGGVQGFSRAGAHPVRLAKRHTVYKMGMKRGVLFAVAVSLIARYGASAFSMSPLVKPHALASSGSLERSRFCGGTREIKPGMATVTR